MFQNRIECYLRFCHSQSVNCRLKNKVLRPRNLDCLTVLWQVTRCENDLGNRVEFLWKISSFAPVVYGTDSGPQSPSFLWSRSGDENGCMVTTCRLYACPLPLHAATDLHLWGATALTQKSPRLNVRAFITSEIMHSSNAQCNNKEQP